MTTPSTHKHKLPERKNKSLEKKKTLPALSVGADPLHTIRSLVTYSGTKVRPSVRFEIPTVTPLDDDMAKLMKGMMAGQQATVVCGSSSVLSWTAMTQTDARSNAWTLSGIAEFDLFAALFAEYRVKHIDQIYSFVQEHTTTSANNPTVCWIAEDPAATSASLTVTEILNYKNPISLQARLMTKTVKRRVSGELYRESLAADQKLQPGGWLPVATISDGQSIILTYAVGTTAVTAEPYCYISMRWFVEFRNRKT